MTVAVIKSIASFFPESVLTNDMLIREGGWDWNPEDIFQKTGISVRHIAKEGECASDLGVAAANRLFDNGCCLKEDIDYLIFCTQSPDYFLPTTACIIQQRLGLKTSCGALDINQGCSGFIYGLSLAKGLIETKIASNILLITAETYSKYINPKDRSTRTIFGDGAAATLIGTADGTQESIGPFALGTDGKGAANLIVPAGGKRMPVSKATSVETEDEGGNIRSLNNLYMNGPEIFNFTLKTVPKATQELLEKTGRQLLEIDYFIFHQANKFMLERLRDKMKIPESRFFNNLESGNTVSSTIPVALETALKQDLIQLGDEVMLVGFGVGYSWAACLVKISEKILI
ncbi:3-oxoacyl-ACP synthase III family protein [Sporomusa acidovorans]|uniref:3-oxoacyl-ACP synthase III family protein n=1 Tax=Sporomusa acidovorans TaxID=112900 RepID=UPI001B8051EA|nr:ketoacyl-ACP synthase III [Sporomusa acidovorans]